MLTMDRIFERAEKINKEWIEFNQWLNELYQTGEIPEEIYESSEKLRSQYVDMITLGQDNAWRIIAREDGLTLPDDEDET